jgi:chorismate dehydratase
MALRIGRLPYLHAEPFYVDMARRGLTLVELTPRAMGLAAANGDIDAGPVPVVESFRLQDRLQAIAGFCIASLEEAGSSLLFSTKPIEALAGTCIGITDEAATTPRLLDVLLRLKYQVQTATQVSLAEPHEAFLLTGNQALRQRMGRPDFPLIYDLGTEWHAWTGLPFVFSRWMVRKDVRSEDVAQLEEALYLGLEEGIEALCEQAEPRQDLVMLPRDIATYIRGFRYFTGRLEQRAIEQFRRYVREIGG